MNKVATQLRKRADAMQKRIDAKLSPAIASQNLTARRARIAAGMAEEGYRLQREQAALRALAQRHEEGALESLRGWHLDGVRFANQVRLILNQYTRLTWEDDAKVLARAGITTQAQLDNARLRLEYLVEQYGTDGPSEEEKALADAERSLVGLKIPGFFPTPSEVISAMLDQVEAVLPWDKTVERVLEPSAGKGDIAERLRRAWPSAKLDVVEINPRLSHLLTLKGFPLVHQRNFLEMGPREKLLADVIVMNPPFEKGQDMEHVRHAYNHLAAGGVLVAIVSEVPFFRQDAKARDFREWVQCRRADNDILLNRAFKEAFNSTCVSTRIITLKKAGSL